MAITRRIKRENVWLMSSKASLPGEIGLSLLGTQHTKAPWSKATTSKLHSANHCFPFVFPSTSEDISPSVSDSLQLTLWVGVLSPSPSSPLLLLSVLRTDFPLTRKFYLASNQSSNTDIHKFQSKLSIRKIWIASKFGKMPCFLQIHKTDETQKWELWCGPAISNAILI